MVVLLADDSFQTLPVIQRDTPTDEIRSCIKSLSLLAKFKEFSLKTNTSVHLHNDIDSVHYAETLLKIGDECLDADAERTRTKLEQLIDIAGRNGVQIVAFQETKLSEHSNIKLKHFSIYRTDRPYGSGGGLVFLVRDVNYKKITSPSRDSDLEMQGISITWKRGVINIFNLYHHPNQGHLSAEIFDCSDKNTIFLGDLNAKHQSWGCSTSNDRDNDLLNADDDRALIFLNSGLPTHTSFSYGTSEALDITLVSPELHSHCDWDILSSIGSDHLPILINVQINRKTVTSHKKFWNIKKANWDCFQRITEGSFDKRTTMDNLEQEWHSFKQVIIHASKQSIPRGNFKHLVSNTRILG
ncbi:hypothetical protein TNCV_3655421 [Trichonephila clavipes]|nr:hypothetical protein TNCV_3655421 [Trichonephila clavipes]